MSNETEKKLRAYFGFASAKRSIAVGMKLEELLSQNKIALLVTFPECSLKNEEKLLRILPKNTLLKHIRYEGSFDIKNLLGYEKLKAVGIKDISLATAIYQTMFEEMKKEEKDEQIQE